LAQTVASRNRAEFRRGPKRRSWVFDY
jgi:hypothetical protein